MKKIDDPGDLVRSEWEHTRTATSLDDVITSGGCRFGDLPEYVREDVIWLDGLHGPATQVLPSIDAVPVPIALLTIPIQHPNRPTGSKAMLDAHGARSRLRHCRPGAWIISTFTGWRWAVWPDGEVRWVPASADLPEALRVRAFNDLN